MKAMVFHGPDKTAWEEVRDATIQKPTDVVVKVETTTICGTDLHILKGDVPAVQDGRILGHEGVGTITEVGSAIGSLSVGDRVIMSCISACGRCDMCKERVFSHCLADEGASGIGWVFGHLIDGTQAEYVRVPFAETSVYPLPDGVTPQEGAMLSDILPTGHEIGVRYGQVKVGDVVVVIGAGPVGLAAIMTARLYGPSKIVAVDLDANRVELAKRFGATHGVLSSDADWKDQVMALTDGLGVDVAIEAVGVPRTFEMCYEVVRPAGHIANVGVHGTGVLLPLDTLWISNITISMGLVNTDTTATLLKMVAEHTLPADLFVSHTFDLDDIEEAYDVFGRAAQTQALKVALNA